MKVEKANLELDVKVPPEKVIVCTCGNCGNEIERREWTSYGYISKTKARIKSKWTKCPKCGILFDHVKTEGAKPTWVKVATNEYKAVARDGDFLVWKDGYAWKCRYRKKGEKDPEWVERYFLKEGAMGKCEQNKNWVV